MRYRLALLCALALLLLGIGAPGVAGPNADTLTYLPLVRRPSGPELSVNPQSRSASRAFFLEVYQTSSGAVAGWTGNHAACAAGTTSAAFRDAILLRINYFRAMAGVPATVAFDDEYNGKAQQAALMMSANRRLSHQPTPDWTCYTAAGDEAAGSSNLFLGVYGVPAIDGYIRDPGAGNYPAGHRRWILYPQTRFMGTGDIPPDAGYPAANALWVFDDHLWEPRPATREPYVAWPPPGYVPYQVVFPRWSLAYASADFTGATVAMRRNGVPIAVAVQPVVNGYGENTLVWEPDAAFGARPAADVVYEVEVANVVVGGAAQRFTYTVTVFDPETGPAAMPAGRLGPPPSR